MKTREKHGMHKTKEYQAWADMKTRCLSPKNPGYKDYGGRGVTVCESWINSFAQFIFNGKYGGAE